MLNYTLINNVWLANTVLPQTLDWLRTRGRLNVEAFALWSGHLEGPVDFIVSTVIIPEQTAFQTSSGIGIYVSGDELFKINQWLLSNQQSLIAQVHSHPSHAYHSDTDDHYPLVTACGQFSVVVPDFARLSTLSLSQCEIYRLSVSKWVYLPGYQTRRIFKVLL